MVLEPLFYGLKELSLTFSCVLFNNLAVPVIHTSPKVFVSYSTH